MIAVYQQTGIDLFSFIENIIKKKCNQQAGRAETFDIPEAAYDTQRKQYHALKVIRAMVDRNMITNDANLLVIQDDIYVHRMNFVFGLADPGTRTAIVSTFRLDGDHLIDRLEKEIVHELGHLAGLDHCPDLRCVMHFSSTLSDTDMKTADLCPACRSLYG